MEKRFWLPAILAVFFLISLAGCAEADDEAFDVVTDQMGREVTIEEIPDRIISLSPSNTEVIFALDLGDRVVGVTEYCNYPPEALEKDQVGGFSTPSIEKIVELEPDLVLASTIHKEEVPRLEELGIPVLVVEASDLEELYTGISLIAEVAGAVPEGQALIGSMQERIGAVEDAVEDIDQEDRIKVYFEVWYDPLMSAGRGAFINEIISVAGGVNIFGDVDENYPEISAEVVIEREPEVILYPKHHGDADFVVETMAGRPGWESIPAIENERIHGVPDDPFTLPSPRIVEAVEEAAELFYPDKF